MRSFLLFLWGERWERKADARGRGYQVGQGLRRGDIAGSGRWREHRTPEGEDIGSGCCGGGVIQLRLRERALLRQGQLFEPTASSGPAAMVLAISRNLSCIPRRSPCPDRYPLPLASVFLSTFRNQQYPPDGVLARTDILFLWRPPKSLPSSMHSPHTPHFTHHRKHPCTNNNHHNTNHTIQQSSLF